MGNRIHIIDDDQTIQSLLQIALAKKGFDVSVSSDSYMVFDIPEPLPDLFLLDVIIPGLNGFEICKWLKSKDPNTRIIIISGTPGLKMLAENCHADDFIQKPFEISALISKVRHALAKEPVNEVE